MKIVLLLHPISGNVIANLERIRKIARNINLTMPNVVPFAPYWLDCHALNDNLPAERLRGIRNTTELMNRGFIDEAWIVGGRISEGMKADIELAMKLKIPVIITEYHL